MVNRKRYIKLKKEWEQRDKSNKLDITENYKSIKIYNKGEE